MILWGFKVGKLIIEIPQLLEMQYFFKHVFLLKDSQLETLPWNEMCTRIIESRNQFASQPSAFGFQPLDAHMIANRILRKDNFMIALVNKRILNLSVPKINYGPLLTQLMEWNINFCIFAWVFDDKGGFKTRFLKSGNRNRLISQYFFKMLTLGSRSGSELSQLSI